MSEYEIDLSGLMAENTPTPEAPDPIAKEPMEPEAFSPAAEEPAAFTPEPTPAPAEAPQWSFPPSPPRKHKKTGMRILAAGLVVVAVAAGCVLTSLRLNRQWQAESKHNQFLIEQLQNQIADLQEQIKDNSYTGNGNSVSGTPGAPEGYLTPGQVYAQNVKSVVAISNQGITTNIYGQVSETASSGSGFIISADGYVVTNYHVIEDARRLTVILHDGSEYDATVVGHDAANDLAVLKIDGENLRPAAIGSSDDLIVGDQVVAIGNPLGELTNSLTAGYVSAKGRTVNTDGARINMLQTDAAINPGNSGGPLFNMKGEVVGITTAKFSGTTGSGASIEGIGFAIPMDDVAKKISNLIQYGYVNSAYLGVTVRDVSQEVSEAYGVPMGASVDSVAAGSCAQKAGIQARDIIVSLGGREITSLNDLTQALLYFKGGDRTTVTVWRSGILHELEIALDLHPNIAD